MRKNISLLLLVLLAACGDGGKNGPPAPGPSAEMPPYEADVMTITRASATISQDLPGRLSAVRSAQVRARVEGVLERRLFTEGTDVAAGKPLFQIDARTYQAQASAAEADLAAAKATFDRYKPLLEIKAVSQQEFDGAHARVKQAEAATAKARLDLENAVSPAPISGRIGRALVTEGALVGRGEATHLATIEQLNPIRVEFSQSYSDLLRLQQAVKGGKQKKADSAKVELVLEDGSLYPEKGRLEFTDLAVDPNSGAVLLRAEFPNSHHELLPGTFVRIRFPQVQFDNTIRVPQRAVLGGPQGQFVLVVDAAGKATRRTIKTTTMLGSDFIVEDGLKEGEQIVVNGLQEVIFRLRTTPGPVLVKPKPWVPGAPVLDAPPAAKPATPGAPPVGEKK